MDSKRIHEDITHLLYKVEDQYGRIIQFKDSIPMLELDLALKDVRDLYESFLDLRTMTEIKRRKLNAEASAASPAPIAGVVEEIKPIDIQKPQDLHVEETAEVPVSEEIPVQVAEEISETAIETVSEIPEELPSVKEESPMEEESVSEAEVVSEKEDSNPGIAWQKTIQASNANEAPIVPPKKDLLQERQKDFVPTVRKIEFKPEPTSNEAKKESIFEKAASLYDKIAKPAEKTVASQAVKQPISNIKGAIGINEKFGYLKDLFKNNVNEYNEALEKLNNFDNYADAEDYFQELKSKYSWDPESKSFIGLADLLNRRYLHNA